MLKNYFIVAMRNLLRHKIYSLINISGLGIGMACCILILLFIQDEFRRATFHDNGHRIFRVLMETRMSGSGGQFSSGTDGGITPATLNDFPEVQKAARVINWPQWVRYGDKMLMQGFCLADPAVLEMFGYSLVRGNPETALRDPGLVVVTESAARRYFGDADPIGKVITVDSDKFGGDYKITGVLRDISPYAYFHFDFLTSSPLPQSPAYFRESAWKGWRPNNSWRPVQNYIMLPGGYPHKELEKKLHAFMSRYMGGEIAAKNIYHLQPFNRIHLYSRVDYGFHGRGDIIYIYQLSLIALFVLLIGCVNFMNLATARSTNRAREIGMRKVVGAHRLQLIGQFLFESVFLSFLALLLAYTLAELVLPAFNAFMGRNMTLDVASNRLILAGFVGLVLFVGLLAGSYPAFFLAAFQPVQVLKGTLKSGLRGAALRKGLVVFQFVISIVLMISTVVVYRQLDYLKHKNLGYNKEQVVLIPLFFADVSLIPRYQTVKRVFQRHPNVLKIAACWPYPGGHVEWHTVRPEGAGDNEWQMQVIGIDEDFLDTFEMELVAGRNINFAIASDTTDAFILNEAAVKKLGWRDPVGRSFQWRNRKGRVIGVVKDFHNQSLRHPVDAVVLFNWTKTTLAVRIRPQNIPVTLKFLEEAWRQFIPHRPFEFGFLDQEVDGAYRAEEHMGQAYGILAGLAILVACLGLFGLSAFTAEQRTKEIGIRKVLGASISSIVLLFSRDFVKLVLIANMVAWPVAYYIMNRWLQNFAYRTDLGMGIFVLGGVLALAIALVTVTYQAMKAARANPVDALRYE
jgi:putative ABC transport system permease protein